MRRLASALAIVIGTWAIACSVQAAEPQALAASLRQGGYVLVVRHGATDPSQKDVYPLDYSDRTRQRQLSDQGRDTARQMGAAMKKLGVPIGTVYTSRLDRAVETGKLISGKDVTPNEALNDSSMGSASAMAGTSGGGSAQHGKTLRQMAEARPAPGTNTIIVTHKTNIQDAFGKDYGDVKEGETIVFKPGGGGATPAVARVQPADWAKLAGGS